MTRTARTLIIGPVVGIGLGLWATGAAAVPAEATRVIADPNAAHRPGSGGDSVLTPPALTDVVAPLALAALSGTAAAFFSARPRHSVRPRVARRRTRG
jgi:hypothetical protein